jgi:hypothetical protein
MQSKDSNSRIIGAVNHPEAGEWMSFLYGELAPERARQMGEHLSTCGVCTEQVKVWRSSMEHLDDWSLPVPKEAARRWVPALKWAAAAAVVLGIGFGLGRRSAPSAGEFASLKASVAQLTEAVQRERNADFSNSVNAATFAANAASLRLLDEYSRLQSGQRTTDQQALNVALQNFDARLGRLQSELETVAVNTASGFQQTHQNLTRLASYSVPIVKPSE